MLDKLSFSEALTLLKIGKSVTRLGWNGVGMHLELQVPDINSKMTLPYIFMCILKKEAYYKRNRPESDIVSENILPPDYDRVPWLASQTDLLSEDWIEL